MRKGFTLIEVIFVIVIMGIVSAATFVSISFIYEEMVQRQAVADMETGAKIAVEQVAARLSTSIKDSMMAADDLNGADGKNVSLLVAGDNNSVLMWVGKSDEANLGLWDAAFGDYIPGWSGFVDVSAPGTTMTNIITKGSKLSSAETIIDSVTGQTNTLTTNPNPPVAIYFHESGNSYNDFFSQNGKMYRVKMSDATTLSVIGANIPTQISEQYTMSHSAYALQRVGTNLMLYSFRPWLGETPNSDNSPKILAEHVSRFGFRWDNEMFRINICESRTINGFTAEVCKERAVF